jgi:hypothetical protein
MEEKKDLIKQAQTYANPEFRAFAGEAQLRNEGRLPIFKAACPEEYARVGVARDKLKAETQVLDSAKKERCPNEWLQEKADKIVKAALFAALYYGDKRAVMVGGIQVIGYETANKARIATIEAGVVPKTAVLEVIQARN